MKCNKGSRIENYYGGGIYRDFPGFKVSGIIIYINYSAGFTSSHRIPPHLLVSDEERLRSIGTQLTLLME